MMSNEEYRAARVRDALDRYYTNGPMDAIAGYDVLRYAKAGYIGILNPNFATEFMAWYPRNPDYLILRMAAKGQLAYVPGATSFVAGEEKSESTA